MSAINVKQEMSLFENRLNRYSQAIKNLLGRKYGISSDEFMIKVVNAVKKNPELLECDQSSLFGSILYFAEIGLPFNTPEGFGYILPYANKKGKEATPIIGYRGLIEIAYRNKNLKSIRIQAVYENDAFEYQYGTTEFLNHSPARNNRGKLICVYAIAKLEGIDPLFVVVHSDELNQIQKLSKSGSSNFSAYNNGTDVFNVMQSKVAIKLLFKTLPKTDNESLLKVLEMDNKFDFEKKYKIEASTEGYNVVENEQKISALESADIPTIDLTISEAHQNLSSQE